MCSNSSQLSRERRDLRLDRDDEDEDSVPTLSVDPSALDEVRDEDGCDGVPAPEDPDWDVAITDISSEDD